MQLSVKKILFNWGHTINLNKLYQNGNRNVLIAVLFYLILSYFKCYFFIFYLFFLFIHMALIKYFCPLLETL